MPPVVGSAVVQRQERADGGGGEVDVAGDGADLYPAIVLMMRWGDRWLDEGRGPPLLLIHGPCGQVSRPVLVCDVCREPVTARDVRWRPGPGATPRWRRTACRR